MNNIIIALLCFAIFQLGCNVNSTTTSNTATLPKVKVAGLTTEKQVYDLVDSTSNKAWKLMDGADDKFPNKEGIKSDFAKVPNYLRTQLTAMKGKHINVILQDHGDPGNQNITPEESTIKSQAKITETLNRLKPSLLAIEGFSQDSLNTKQEVIKELTVMLSPESKKDPSYDRNLAEAFQSTLNRQAGMKYGLDHPECRTFGAELLGVNVFTFLATDDSSPPEAKMLYRDVQPVRAWIMLSRLNEFMDKYKTSEGTLIIGSLHYSEISDAARIFKFDVDFIDTVH